MQALRAKYKNVHTDLLDRVATQMAKTVEKEEDIEAAITAQDGFITGIAEYSQKETDRRVTEAVKKREAELKAEAEKNKKPEDKDKDKDKKPEDMPEWAKGLTDTISTLNTKLAALEQEKTQGTLSQKLTAKLKDLKVPEKFYSIALKGRTLKDDTEVDELATTIEAGYKEYLQEISEQGLEGHEAPMIPGSPPKGVSFLMQEKIKSEKDGSQDNLGGKKL